MLSGYVRRLRGDQIVTTLRDELRDEMREELGSIRDLLLNINHVVIQLHEVVETLNHDVRAGAEPALPMFLGHAERLRLDADTAIGATQVIERQLALLSDQIAALEQAQTPGT
ncbi:hypothetical protein BH23ACT3_BH23ACT3_23870 [soil metagenome]